MAHSMSEVKNIGAYLKGKLAVESTDITAGAGSDGSAINGETIELREYEHQYGIPRSAAFIIGWETTLNDDESLTLKAELEHRDSGGSWSAVEDVREDDMELEEVVAKAPDDNSLTTEGVLQFNVDLSGCKEEVRLKLTPTMSRGETDTATVYAIAVLGGYQQYPVSETHHK